MKQLNSLMKRMLNKYRTIPVAARAGLWFVVCSMLQKCISFITVPIFTRIMPTEEYGLYSTYLSWYAILTIFCTLNMHSVVYVNDYTRAKNQKEKDFTAIPLLSLSFVITLIIFAVYLLMHNALDQFIGLPLALMCLLFAQILFEPPVNFWVMKQRFEYKYVILVVQTITMTVLNAALGIAFVWLSYSNEAIARACSIVLVQIIFGALFYIYFIKRGKKIFSVKGWKHALKVQLPLLLHNLSIIVLSSSDRIMISNMIGKAQAGIYSVAYSAGYVVNMLKLSIVDALRPWLYQKLKEEEYQTIRRTVNIVMIMVLMICVLFTAFAPEVIFIMAPSQYYEAIYVIPPVAASAYFIFLYNIFSMVGLYYEKSNKIMLASVSAAVLNLVLNFICIPLFGYIAAAYTTLICYIFFSLAHYLIMKSICKSELNNARIYDIKFIILMSCLALASMLIFNFTYKYIVIRYGIIAALILIAFLKRKVFISTFKELKRK